MNRPRQLAIVLAAALSTIGPVRADGHDSFLDMSIIGISPEAWAARSFSDRDVAVLFDFVKQTFHTAFFDAPVQQAAAGEQQSRVKRTQEAGGTPR